MFNHVHYTHVLGYLNYLLTWIELLMFNNVSPRSLVHNILTLYEQGYLDM